MARKLLILSMLLVCGSGLSLLAMMGDAAKDEPSDDPAIREKPTSVVRSANLEYPHTEFSASHSQLPGISATISGPGAGPGNIIYYGLSVTLEINLNNTTGDWLLGINHGFRVYSPDGAMWSPITYDTAGGLDTCFDQAVYTGGRSITGSGADTCWFAGIGTQQFMPAGYNDTVFRIATQVDAAQVGKTLCIDSSFFPPGGTWVWSTSGEPVYPSWDGPHCFEIMPPGYLESTISATLSGPGAGPDSTIYSGHPVTIDINLLNNPAGDTLLGISNGFRVYSPDGAAWSPITYDSAGGLDICFKDVFTGEFGVTGSGADTCYIAGIFGGGKLGMPPGYNDVVLRITTEVDASQVGKTLCIDSSFFPPGGTWKWVTICGDVYPNWDGPHCFEIVPIGYLEPTIIGQVVEFEEDYQYRAPDQNPIGKRVHELWPDKCRGWIIASWHDDDNNGELSVDDNIDLKDTLTGNKIWRNVEWIGPTLKARYYGAGARSLDTLIYLEWHGDDFMARAPDTGVIGTWWHEVNPKFCQWRRIDDWLDNGNHILDSCDWIVITRPDGGWDSVHVRAIRKDAILTPKPPPDSIPPPRNYDYNLDDFVPGDGDPTGTMWREVYPNYAATWELNQWFDNDSDGILGHADYFRLQSPGMPDSVIAGVIEEVTVMIAALDPVADTFYLNYMRYNPLADTIWDPIYSYWLEIRPEFQARWFCNGWADNGNGHLDPGDSLTLLPAPVGGPDTGLVVDFLVVSYATSYLKWYMCDYYKSRYLDYAPQSVPDFDMKQEDWDCAVTTTRSIWTHDGPAAVANCLWWLDSKFEPDPVDPRPFPPAVGSPEPNDGYPLVGAYGDWDDHDPDNVQPLIEELAGFMGTCVSTHPTYHGTEINNLVSGTQQYMASKGLANTFTHHLEVRPTFEYLKEQLLMSQDVILLLGFFEERGWDYYPVGGHYVTLAGLCTYNLGHPLLCREICISDPWFDVFEMEPPAGWAHGPEVHNDAYNISGPHCQIQHDQWRLLPFALSPWPETELVAGYPPAKKDGPDIWENFENLNIPGTYEDIGGIWTTIE